ncbi:SCO family protein [Hydrogenophaga sp. XSHU_21]
MKFVAPRAPLRRRSVLALSASWLATSGLLAGCSPQAPTFKSTDITGASFAQDFKLTDHTGQVRTMADFRGKAVVVFFGFTQCPDVCPTSMTTLADVKRLMGSRGEQLQVLFITVDPERDTLPLLKEYMSNFDPSFLALRPEPTELKTVADQFKITFRKVEGQTPTSYTMDHSAGKYVFDRNGAVRLYSSYGTEAAVLAEDILTLLKSMEA